MSQDDKRSPRKLVNFATEQDMEDVQKDLENGWILINVVLNDKHCYAILEEDCGYISGDSVFIPPMRNRIKIHKT